MPRTPRLDYPGARHHCMNRGARKEPMFLDDDCCALFMDALAELPERFGVRVHGYALMPNHYHLMLEVPRGNLSDAMKHLGATFTQAYNRKYGLDGPIFRGRFRNEVVQDDAYWMHLLAYLHLNPVRARLVKRPERCPWTSHAAYRDSALRPTWLTTGELIDLFGSQEALIHYIDEVRVGGKEPPKGFDAERFWVASNTTATPAVQPVEPRPPEQALDEVAAVLGVPVEGMLTRSRGRSPNVGTWLAVWWLQLGAQLTQAEVARRLNVSRPRVSQLRTRLFKLSKEDPSVHDAMMQLESLLR